MRYRIGLGSLAILYTAAFVVVTSALDDYKLPRLTEPLTCQTNEQDGGSIQCSFTLPADVDKFPTMIFEGCLENDESVCMKLFASVDRRQPVVGHTRTSNPPASTTEASSSSSLSDSVVGVDDRRMIIGGSSRYNKPYAQFYAPDVAAALVYLETIVAQAHEASSSSSSSQTKRPSISDQAQAFVALGTAHRTVLQEYMDESEEEQRVSGGNGVDMNRIHSMTEQAMTAMDQAVQLYRGQLPSKQDLTSNKNGPATHKQLFYSTLLAHVYFSMSDLWALVAYFDETKRQDAKEFMLQALEYFRLGKDANLDELTNDDEATIGPKSHYTPLDQLDAAYYFGQSLMRLGVLQMSVTQALQLQHEHATVGDLLDDFQDQTRQEELMERLTGSLQELTKSIQTAQTYFEQAAELFEKELQSFIREMNTIHPADKVLYQLNLAAALQHLGENKIALGQLAMGTDDGERALTIYEEILERTQYVQEADLYDARHSAADLMFALSRAFLQQAKYDKASHYYHRAMAWYDTHEISPSSNTGDGYKLPEADGTIDEYEELLEEYNMLKAGASDVELPEEVTGWDGEGAVFAANDAYESAIRSTLGYLYMSTGDIYQATSHMSQALFLLRKSTAEQDETLADLLYNMAMLKFSSGDFEESASFFDQALDVFRSVVPPGENPLSRSVDSISLESIQAMIQAESEWVDSEPLPGDNSADRQQEAVPAPRKVLTLQKTDESPKKDNQKSGKRSSSETDKKKAGQRKLSRDLEDFLSSVKLQTNGTADEL